MQEVQRRKKNPSAIPKKGVNVLVLWNTIYMDAAIEHLKENSAGVDAEDVTRLSPLEHQNVNFLGQYNFALSEAVAQGQLRQRMIVRPQRTISSMVFLGVSWVRSGNPTLQDRLRATISTRNPGGSEGRSGALWRGV